MEDEDAEEHCSDGSDASPNRVSDAYWDGLSCLCQEDSTKHIEKCEARYPCPEFGTIDKFSFS